MENKYENVWFFAQFVLAAVLGRELGASVLNRLNSVTSPPRVPLHITPCSIAWTCQTAR